MTPEEEATDIALAIAELKAEVLEAVKGAVERFRKRTTLTPSTIDITMMDMTTHSDRFRITLPTSVHITLGKF